MPHKPRTTDPCEIRQLRVRLQLSQPEFAERLGVAAETYRTWDSGRRAVPEVWLAKARALVAVEGPDRQWSLPDLAVQLGVHVRTLRDAARSGRLVVTYGNRCVFRHPVPKATLAAGRTFLERYYKQSYSRFAPRPTAPPPVRIPPDYAQRLRDLRKRLHLTQTELADRIQAAGKAVIYQWESQKRRPSPVFWRRVERLVEASLTDAQHRPGSEFSSPS